jgi:hypothetical protein
MPLLMDCCLSSSVGDKRMRHSHLACRKRIHSANAKRSFSTFATRRGIGIVNAVGVAIDRGGLGKRGVMLLRLAIEMTYWSTAAASQQKTG